MVDSENDLVRIADEWTVEKFLGSGSYSKVYQVTCMTTGKVAAAKVFNKGTDFEFIHMRTECEILSSLAHKNVVSALKFVDAANLVFSNGSTSRATVLFTEYGTNGDFLALLERVGPLNEETARTYFHQIIETMEYIHEQKICHFDIKPENFVLDEEFNLKLCDFGCSSTFTTTDTFKGVVGTSDYLAPEAFLDQFYSGKKVDIFACGVMLFAMVTGHHPFEKASRDDEMYSLICERKFSRFWAIHKEKFRRDVELSEGLQDLIIKMLRKYPSDRTTLDGIKAHAWFQGPVLDPEKLNKQFTQ